LIVESANENSRSRVMLNKNQV